MIRNGLPYPARVLGLALVTAFGASLTGLAFAGWLDHGAQIFLAMVESGLAMCF